MTELNVDNNITIIASGKGGVGKTFLATSMAQCLAKFRRKVLLLDGDLGLANIDIQLGLMPDYDLWDVLEGKCEFNQAIMAYPSADSPCAMDIVTGRSGSGSLGSISEQQLFFLKQCIVSHSATYDEVFIDLGAGVDDVVQSLSTLGKRCFLVINDEPTSLTDGYAFIKVISNKNPNMEFLVIVNSAKSLKEGQRTYQTLAKVCQNFLHWTPKLLGVVQLDSNVKDSIRHQTSHVIRFPSSNASQDIEQIAKRIIQGNFDVHLSIA